MVTKYECEYVFRDTLCVRMNVESLSRTRDCVFVVTIMYANLTDCDYVKGRRSTAKLSLL
jgi:hypothetical protein